MVVKYINVFDEKGQLNLSMPQLHDNGAYLHKTCYMTANHQRFLRGNFLPDLDK